MVEERTWISNLDHLNEEFTHFEKVANDKRGKPAEPHDQEDLLNLVAWHAERGQELVAEVQRLRKLYSDAMDQLGFTGDIENF